MYGNQNLNLAVKQRCLKQHLFKTDLKTTLLSGCGTYAEFEKIFLSTLDLHAPYKTKLIRANHARYMTKALRKAIMRRSQLQSKYFKTKSHVDLRNNEIL